MEMATWVTLPALMRSVTGSLTQVGETPLVRAEQATGNASAENVSSPTGSADRRNTDFPATESVLTSVRGPSTVMRRQRTSLGTLVRATSASPTSSATGRSEPQ